MTRLLFCVFLYAFVPEMLVADIDYGYDEAFVSPGSHYTEMNHGPEQRALSRDTSTDYESPIPYPENLPPTSDNMYPFEVTSEEQEDAETVPRISIKSTCKLPLHPGFCKGRFRVWGYDWKAKSCVAFLYHGCGGNENNFARKKHCETKCSLGNNLDAELGDSEPILEDYDNPNEVDGDDKINV